MTMRLRSLVALLLALAMVAAACGGDDDSTDTADETDTGTATTAAPDAEDDADAEADAEESSEDTDGEAAASGDGTTLVIWADELKVGPLEEIAPAFTEATGVEVQVELVPFADIREQVTQAGPAGEGPDIFAGAHDWTGELAANGVIDPVDLSAKADQFVAAGLDGFNFEGQNYAVPYVTEAVALFRNTEVAPDAPATWDELVTSCDGISVGNCVVMPGGGDATDAYHNYPFVSAYGGYIFAYDDETGFDASDVGLDSPEAIEGIQFLETQVADGIVASTNGDTAKNLFLEGDAAYFISGPWQVSDLDAQDTVDWEVSVVPQIGDEPAEPFVGAQGFFLSAFSENQLLAQSFLVDFIATDETMQALYDADPRGTAWVTVQEGLGSDPVVQAFADSAANGVPMPNIPQMASVWGPLGDNLLLVRNAELGADEAMTTAAEAVRSAVSG